MTRVLYILVCGAPPARDVGVLARLAQDRGWDVCVVTSARGRTFVDADALEAMTGHPVRSGYKDPGEPEVLPSADALIVAPATTNTINKWAAGISDTLPLGLLVEGIGKGLPIVAMPFTNRAQAAHPVFEPNIELLRSWGVTVLYGPDVYLLHEPGEGWQTITRFPWHLTLQRMHGSSFTMRPQRDLGVELAEPAEEPGQVLVGREGEISAVDTVAADHLGVPQPLERVDAPHVRPFASGVGLGGQVAGRRAELPLDQWAATGRAASLARSR